MTLEELKLTLVSKVSVAQTLNDLNEIADLLNYIVDGVLSGVIKVNGKILN